MGLNISPRQTAGNHVYLQIKEMISRYQLIPGQKITYEQLAQRLQVSKTPIINALNRLEQDGFVVSVPNRGFQIRETGVEEIAELFRIREVLEILAVEECIKNIQPKMLKMIDKARVAHQAYDYGTPTRNRLALDATFHLRIAEAGGNSNLVKMIRHVLDHIYVGNRTESIPPKRVVKAAREHQEIFEAIRKKKIPQARRAMRNHIRAGKTTIIRGMQIDTQGFQF